MRSEGSPHFSTPVLKGPQVPPEGSGPYRKRRASAEAAEVVGSGRIRPDPAGSGRKRPEAAEPVQTEVYSSLA